MKIDRIKVFSYDIALILLFFVCFCYSLFSGDKLPIVYSEIFDAKNYIDIVQNFSRHIYNQDFISYYNSRILIPLFAGTVLKLLKISSSIENIEVLFLVLNILSLIIGIIFYFKIAKFLKFENTITILGFSLLFVNFFSMKLSLYYPILMDVFGFSSGLVLFYYYLAKKQVLFYCTLLLSMFIFPTTIIIALCLLASSFIKFDNNKGVQILPSLNLYTAIITAALTLTIVYFSYFVLYTNDFTTVPPTIQFSKTLLPISIILFIIFMYFLLKNILKIMHGFSINIKKSNLSQILLSLIIILTFLLASKFLSLNFKGQSPLDSVKFITNLLVQYLSFPLKFLISHFIYFGFFIIFILYFRKSVFNVVKNTNPFFKLVFIASILLMLGTESRQFIQFYPFVTLLLLISIKEFKFSKALIFSIFAIQLVISRFWYTINNEGGFLGKMGSNIDFQEFPAQRYFQFQGPWLSTSNSLYYALILILTYYSFVLIVKKSNFEKVLKK